MSSLLLYRHSSNTIYSLFTELAYTSYWKILDDIIDINPHPHRLQIFTEIYSFLIQQMWIKILFCTVLGRGEEETDENKD